MKHKTIPRLLLTALVSTGAGWLASSASAQNIFVSNWYSPGAIYDITESSQGTDAGQTTFYSGSLGEPLGLAFNTSGNLFVADSLGNEIDEFIGGTETPFASVNHPVWLAFNNSGTLFASSADGDIYTISSTGSVNTFTTGLSAPTGMAFDQSGDLFVNNWGAGTIVEYQNSSGGLSNTGNIFARGLVGANGLAFDAAGNLYSAEDSTGTGDILEFTPQGHESVFVQNLGGYGELAFDSSGNLFMSNGEDLLKITPSASVSTFAENLGNSTGIAIQNQSLPVPEPTSCALLAMGATAVLIRRRKRSQ